MENNSESLDYEQVYNAISNIQVDEQLRFSLERGLQTHLAKEWANIQQFQSWDLYQDNGRIIGVEYDTKAVGRIDLLAKHKSKPHWLIIELKKDKTSDKTLGQIQRYMGWVAAEMAEPTDRVFGIIIAAEINGNLKYATAQAQNIALMKYKLDIKLEMVQ